MPLSLLTADDFVLRDLPEARRRLAIKAALTSEQFDRLSTQARQRAFRVANVNNARLIQGVRNQVEKSIRDGRPWGETRTRLMRLFDVAGEETPALHRLAQVFRTNVQQAYNQARREVFEEEIETFPYWQYLTVGNGTPGFRGVRDTHAALHGLVFRADDPFWDKHYPPWDYNCRCTVVALTPGQVKALGVAVRDERYVRRSLKIGPNAAFDRTGDPDLSSLDDEIRKVLEETIGNERSKRGTRNRRMPRAAAGAAYC